MKNSKFLSVAVVTAIYTTSMLYADSIYVRSGWNLKGTTYEITDTKKFLDDRIVSKAFVYRDSSYIDINSKPIQSNEGFFIYADRSGTLYFDGKANESASSSSSSNPPAIPTAITLNPKKVVSRAYSCELEDWWDDWKDYWKDAWKNWRGYSYKYDSNHDKDSVCEGGYDKNDIKMKLDKGYNLKGTSIGFRIRDVFDNSCVENTDSIIVFRSGNNRYYKYDKDSRRWIYPDEGFWVKAKSSCTLTYN